MTVNELMEKLSHLNENEKEMTVFYDGYNLDDVVERVDIVRDYEIDIEGIWLS